LTVPRHRRSPHHDEISIPRASFGRARQTAPNDKGYETDFPAMLLIQQTQRSAEALSCVRQTGKQTMTHVLVVDDDEDVLTVLVEMLRDAGFCVTTADNSSPCCGFVPTRQF